MDALETGKRIQNLRKQHGWTQKALAEQLCVSDKAVSKWERGLNFPDMAILEPLAKVLETTVVELLGIENVPEAEKVEAVTAVAAEETARMRKEISQRALTCCINGAVITISQFVLAGLLYRLEIYDVWLQALSLGMTSFSGLLVGNCLWIWWKHRT